MNFKIIEMPSANIIASTTFSRRETMANTNVESVINAFDEALGGVMKRAVQWTLATVDDYREANAEELGIGDITRSLDDIEETENRAAENAAPSDIPEIEGNESEIEDVVPTSDD